MDLSYRNASRHHPSIPFCGFPLFLFSWEVPDYLKQIWSNCLVYSAGTTSVLMRTKFTQKSVHSADGEAKLWNLFLIFLPRVSVLLRNVGRGVHTTTDLQDRLVKVVEFLFSIKLFCNHPIVSKFEGQVIQVD